MDTRLMEQIEPLNKRSVKQNNHFANTDDGSLRLGRKDKLNTSKCSSFGSSTGGNRSNRVRKKATTNEQCVSNLKMILQCYNIVILIVGCGVLSVGIWLLVKEFNTREMSAIVGSRVVEIISYGLIAGGGAATLLAFCGCCGTMKQERFVLGFYGVVLMLVLVTLCTGFGVSFIFKVDLAEGIKKRFETTIIYNYGIDVQKNTTNKLITDAWDSMQQTLECCGAHGDVNGVYSWGIYKQQSQWHKLSKQSGNRVYVPESCCADDQNRLLCQGNNDKYDGPPVYGPPNSEHRTHKDNPYMYTTGCYDKAMVYLKQHFVIVAVVTGSVPLILLIGIVIAFYLCANIKEADDDEVFEYEVEV